MAGAVPGMAVDQVADRLMEIAEMLVDKCTHQYLYVLQRVGTLDDGSDDRLCCSPIRMKRSLSKILIAYHALANVRFFYDRARSGGREDELEYVDANQPAITGALANLDAPLRDNAALTELGRGLYEPLAHRLTDRHAYT
jgi:HEXXH motif-containing protein